MNKLLSASELDVPPLSMLVLAVISLVFNLCFPQYAAYAYSGNQEFIRENELRENAIALNKLKGQIAEEKNAPKIASAEPVLSSETYAELTLEKDKKAKTAPKAPRVAAKPVAKAPAASQAITPAPAASAGTSSRWVTVTAYSSTIDQCDSSPFVTASGTRVRDGVIATNLLAFGTKVKFPSIYGDKIFTVEDRMNKRFTNRADIWFASREEAIKFGVRKLEMVIVS